MIFLSSGKKVAETPAGNRESRGQKGGRRQVKWMFFGISGVK